MQYFVMFLFLSFLLSFPIHGSSEFFDYPFRYCSDATFSPNSATYLSNLQILSSALSSNASHKLYHNASVGRSPKPTAYGDFQCRGDLDATTCQQCVATVTANASQNFCPLSVGAVIWTDECVLRYSNKSFFSFMAEKPSWVIFNVINVEESMVDAFDKVVATALNATAVNASSVRGALKFGTKEANFRGLTIYTLAQCTEDMSNFNCGKCLTHALQKLPFCCSGKEGARFMSPSCTFRYELYPFYGHVAPPPAPVRLPVRPPPVDSPSFPASPSTPAPSTAAPLLLSGKWKATVAMVIGGVVAAYFSAT